MDNLVWDLSKDLQFIEIKQEHSPVVLMRFTLGEIAERMFNKQVLDMAILDCLKVIAKEGSYDGGAVNAFNAIKEKYQFDVDYAIMADGE